MLSTQGVTRYIYRGHRKEVLAVAWSPNGQQIASAGEDWTVQVWKVNLQKGAEQKQPFVYQQHVGNVWTLAWSPDGQSLASASADGEVHVWQAV